MLFLLHKLVVLFDIRMNPFGLIIVLDSNGNAEGDLFYDDGGETIDTIETNTYFYATYQWSSQCRQLKIDVVQNNYAQMSNLTLNSLAIYGLKEVPPNITVNDKHVSVIMRSQTQIVDVTELGLSMSNSYTFTWFGNDQKNITCNKTLTHNTSSRAVSSTNGRAYIILSKNTFFCIFVLSLYILFH
jgi:hypothetical protein